MQLAAEQSHLRPKGNLSYSSSPRRTLLYRSTLLTLRGGEEAENFRQQAVALVALEEDHQFLGSGGHGGGGGMGGMY